jgi:diguanylate cyclase (GGDEF)-like protein/PAS domain S-box-containing protein
MDIERERLEFALVGTRLGLWDWNMATGETVFNDRWAEIVGYSLDELTPTTIETWLSLAHPDDLPLSEAAIEAHTRGDCPAYDVEVRMIHRDGHTVWVHDRGQIMEWADDGSPLRMVGTHEDITARVEATQRLAASEERFSQLFHDHQAAMLLVDPAAFIVLDANQAAADLYGYSIGDMVGMELATIDHVDPVLLRERLSVLMSTGGGRFIVTNRRADGIERQIEVHTSVIRSDDRMVFFSILNDVTDREEQALLLRQAAAVFGAVSEGVLITDGDGIVLRANEAFVRLTGFRPEQIVGQHARDIISPAVPDESARVMGDEHVRGAGSRDEIPILHADGTTSASLVTVNPIPASDGQPAGYVVLVADLAEHVEAEQATLDRATFIDSITELANRRGFLQEVGMRLAHRRRTDRFTALLAVDIDRFKDVNDSYGHAAGDAVLQAVGERLRELASTDDVLARLGDDEFALFAGSLRRLEDVDLLARDIQCALGRAIPIGDSVEVFVSTCIGITLVTAARDTSEEITQQAVAALAEAKRAGPGSIRHHDESLGAISRARLTLETRLRRAWEERHLVVHYQPQMAIASENVVGAEALLRWPTEGGGQVPPSAFIAVAEQIGLIGEIGEWVLHEACAQAARWRAEGLPDLSIAVNVSARQLTSGSLPSEVARALSESGLPPRLVELELTESALLESGARTLGLLNDLNALGVRLSIDDFGTGYSSFAYLKRFPLDQLKVDRSFVSDLEVDAEDRAITNAIITLGHTLGLNVLAEGVETPGQLRVLRELACDAFQGYLISPALPPASFAELVRMTL